MPPRSAEQLRRDALEIWRAGVAAVDSARLVREALAIEGSRLVVDDEEIDLTTVRRIIVVGCGKAGAGMAAGVEESLGDELAGAHDLVGWVNVPADCVRRLKSIELHAARPAGRNEPTEAGVAGTLRMLELVESAGPDDLVICLISGGGSALLPAPIDGVSLADKQAVTKFLSGAGANITELNTVRKALSRVKGGGLARACRAGRLISIVISDVLGDPLDVIASGPTVPSTTTSADALAVLERFSARAAGVPAPIFAALERRRNDPPPAPPTSRVTNLVVGNNATAVDAAGVVAERLGYSHAMVSARAPEGAAEDVGRHLAAMAVRMRGTAGPDCLITGGEPTVTLAPEGIRGKGGRNQQLALAALESLVAGGATDGVVLLSGGTDGEDGPTDAAGAIVDPATASEAARRGLMPADFLRRNDAYHFFEPLDGLIKTGPTHTNVCDVRVVVVSRAD
jgi:hydroxypyruvate reductase